MNIEQRALQFSCQGASLVGILDVPERPHQRGVLVVSGGPHYRVGSHRHYTLLSRLLAPRGIAVMRFDYRGMGDSEGEARSFDAIDDDIRAAIKEFMVQVPDLRQIVIWGLGDGATAASLYAAADARVCGLVLLNPWAGSGDATDGPLVPQLLARFGEIGFWKKVGSRNACANDTSLPLPQRIVASLSCFDGATLVLLGGADAIGRQFADLLEKNRSRFRRVTIAGANHTFASRAWRDEVAEISAGWLVSW
jgi:pimeloyl-ACP methyl ester carboxylesterase